jgi:hypothetical protein
VLQTLKKLKARVRYLIDRAFAREFAGQLLLFFVLVVTVTLIGMTAIFFGLFSPQNANIVGIPHSIDKGFWDSMWWSLNQVLRLRGFERMYGATGAVLAYALFLSLMGLVVFSVLISLINNTMRSRIEALRRGETPVLERGHVLVLGWSNKVFSVLRQLASLEPGAKVVILAQREIKTMQEELRVSGVRQEKLTIILRSGVPSNRGELERVALDHASSVIILSTDADDSESIRDLIVGLGVDDVVIGPNVVSAQLAQISRQDVLGPIYRELLSAGGIEISLRPAGDYVALDTDCHYHDLTYAAQ